MELERASASMDTRATPSIPSVDAVVSVKRTMIVHQTSLALEISASTLALELAEAMRCAKSRTTFHFAHALSDTPEIHSSLAEKNPERPHREPIHAFHRLAVPIRNVAK